MRYIVPIMLLFVSSMTYSSQKAQELTIAATILQTDTQAAHPTSPAGTKAPGEYRDAHPTSPPRPPREKSAGKDTEPPTGKAPGEHHDHLQRRGSGGDCSTDPPPMTRSPQHVPLKRPGGKSNSPSRTVSPQHVPSQRGGDCQTEPPKKGKASPQPQPAQMLTAADTLAVDLKRGMVNTSPPITA